MIKHDVSCFTGTWPFYKMRRKSLDDLKKLHYRNEITGGFVSSLESIFYNDPYESELELSYAIKGSEYRQIMTVNPLLPGCLNDIRRGAEDLGISAVRIYPGFHNYSLVSAEVLKLCELLRELKLPLYITMRMEDERVSYMLCPKKIPLEEIIQFIKSQVGFPIVFTNIRIEEIFNIKDTVLQRNDVFFDCSGLKDGLYPVQRLYECGIAKDHLIYGSNAPINCLKSTLLLVEADNNPLSLKKTILSGEKFLKCLQRD